MLGLRAGSWVAGTKRFFRLNKLAEGSLSFPAIFLAAGMIRLKHFMHEHPDLAVFLGLIVLVLLMRFALETTENLTTVLVGTSGVVVSLLARRRADT
jgi:uncharacterized membrane protein